MAERIEDIVTLSQVRCPSCGNVLCDGYPDHESKVRVKCTKCGTFWNVELNRFGNLISVEPANKKMRAIPAPVLQPIFND